VVDCYAPDQIVTAYQIIALWSPWAAMRSGCKLRVQAPWPEADVVSSRGFERHGKKIRAALGGICSPALFSLLHAEGESSLLRNSASRRLVIGFSQTIRITLN